MTHALVGRSDVYVDVFDAWVTISKSIHQQQQYYHIAVIDTENKTV